VSRQGDSIIDPISDFGWYFESMRAWSLVLGAPPHQDEGFLQARYRPDAVAYQWYPLATNRAAEALAARVRFLGSDPSEWTHTRD